MPYVNITGLWSKNGKAPGVRMTPELRQKFMDIPDGTYLNLYRNDRKSADNHPDWNLAVTTPQQADQPF